jgi:hypothetical protein
MSRGFFDNNKDIDSEAEIARRRTLIERLERKHDYKVLLASTSGDSGRE